MPKRSEEDEFEWTMRKDDILKLYVEKDKPLSEVIRAMARQGFTRTKPQYERSLKRWRVSKNVREEEWDFIFGRLDERKRPTNVTVRGVAISQSRLERQRSRKRETTFDRCMSQLHPYPRSRTPEGIEISSPLPAPNDENLSPNEMSEHHVELSEQFAEPSNDYFEAVLVPEGDHPLPSSRIALAPSALSPVMTVSCPDSGSSVTPAMEGFVTSQYTAVAPFSSGPLYNHIYQFLFISGCGHVSSTAKRQALLDFRQTFNKDNLNRAGNPVLRMFVKWAIPGDELKRIARSTEDQSELLLLRLLLQSCKSDLQWISFGYDLLRAAVSHENLPLLNAVIDGGIDVNKQLVFPDGSVQLKRHFGLFFERRMTALQFAVLSRRQDLIEILSGHGATILTTSADCDVPFLRDAVDDEAMDLAQPLLAKLATSRSDAAQHGTKLLNQAVHYADLTVIDVLLQAGFSPYSCSVEQAIDYSRIASFENLSRVFNTPFMAALDGYRKECIRRSVNLSSNSKLILRMIIMVKLLSFPTANLSEEQQLSRHDQVALAYVFATLAGKHELQQVLHEKTGIDPGDIVDTIFDHKWNRITDLGGEPSTWLEEKDEPAWDELLKDAEQPFARSQ